MNCSITNRHPQSPFSYSASKLPNHTLTRAKFIPIFDSTNYEDAADHIQTPSPHKDSKEALISNFIQRRDEIIKKIAEIYQQTDDESTRITELRRLIFIKPHIQEAVDVKNLLKDSGSRRILQDLTNDIELSACCLQNLLTFCQNKNSLPQAGKTIKTSHVIETTWQQIYRLPVYDPLLISEVSRVEWIFRAFEVLSHN